VAPEPKYSVSCPEDFSVEMKGSWILVGGICRGYICISIAVPAGCHRFLHSCTPYIWYTCPPCIRPGAGNGTLLFNFVNFVVTCCCFVGVELSCWLLATEIYIYIFLSYLCSPVAWDERYWRWIQVMYVYEHENLESTTYLLRSSGCCTDFVLLRDCLPCL
jgi:hypothetical protein